MKTKSDVLICGQLVDCLWLLPRRLLSRDHHVIIWTNQSPADSAAILCVNVKLIHVDRTDREMSMTPDFNTGVHDTKTEPTVAQLAILSLLHLWFKSRAREGTKQKTETTSGT